MRQTRETRVTRVLPEFSFPLTEKVGLADQSATTLLTPPLSALNCHSCAGLALGGQAQTHLDYEKPAGSLTRIRFVVSLSLSESFNVFSVLGNRGQI